jgi:23S rRNA pseudouridine2605 synthase
MTAERLQKLLARAGFGSRRACEDLITGGRVSVDGRVVIELGVKADLETQDIRLDGSRLKPEQPEYWILNKPKDVVCTNFDPSGRKRPIDIMQRYTKARLFPVGRLDTDTKGLLLMTNDGPLTNRLTHPRYEVPKTYVATVVGDLTPDAMRRLRRGIWLAEGRTRPAQVRVISHGRSKSIVEITIREGRNRQVRRMLARLEHNVRELVRTRVGRITLRGMKMGEARRLAPDEIEYLKQLPDMPPEAAPAFDKARAGRLRGPRRFEEGRPGRDESSEPTAGQGEGAAGPPVEARRPSAGRPDRGPRRFGKREPGAGPSRDRGPRRFDKSGPRRFEKRGPGDERGRDRGPPRFDKAGPRRFDKRGPGGEPSRDRGPRRFDKTGPRRFDKRGPRPEQDRGDDGPPLDVEHPFAARSDRGPPRGPPRFDKSGPRRFDKSGPRRFDKRGPGAGPGDERGRDRGPPRFDKSGPRRFDKRGPGAGQGDERGRDRGPPRFDKSGPRRFDKRGPGAGPGDERGRDRGPPRFDKFGPRRKDSGKFNRESKGGSPGRPRDSYREKRSGRQHDTDGTRKAGEGHRGHEGRGGRGGRGRPDRPPFGGRRPDRRPPE